MKPVRIHITPGAFERLRAQMLLKRNTDTLSRIEERVIIPLLRAMEDGEEDLYCRLPGDDDPEDREF